MDGIEETPTFHDKKERLNNDMDVVKTLEMNVLSLELDENSSLTNQDSKDSVMIAIKNAAKTLTLRIKDARMAKQKKEMNIKSMIDAVGGESKWRSSKLVNAISRAKCELVQVKDFIREALQTNKEACLIARSFASQGNTFCFFLFGMLFFQWLNLLI